MKLSCLFGVHDWSYYGTGIRQCTNCLRAEEQQRPGGAWKKSLKFSGLNWSEMRCIDPARVSNVRAKITINQREYERLRREDEKYHK